MSEKPEGQLEATPEQILYAKILEKGMYIGLLALLITFALYAFGIMKPYIPVDKLPTYWTMNVHDYLHHAEIKAGWAWLGMLRYGDFINFVGIAFLAGVTIICDKIYAVLALLEAIILAAAASGLIAGGH